MRIFKEKFMCGWCCIKLFTKVISLHDLDMVFRVIKGDFNGTDILDSDLKVVALDNLVTPWGVFFAIPDGWSKEVKYDLSSQIPHCLVDLIIPNDEGKKVVEDLSLISDEPSRELHGSHWFNWFARKVKTDRSTSQPFLFNFWLLRWLGVMKDADLVRLIQVY